MPYRVVEELRKKGFDVLSVAEDMRGFDDEKILKTAIRENRILVTNDKDFGEMVYRGKIKRRGVVLLRLRDDSFENTLKCLSRLFDKFGRTLQQKDLVVVTEKSIRIRSF
jgi:predicted nuclease of predicted toxin-antitoxin system